ncbi:MAG: tetratricopeptide repeat protein [Thermodesulfovibrionales bacterium]
MGKLAILVIIIFLGVMAAFAVSNQGSVAVNVPFGDVHEVSKIALVLIASAFGALMTLFVFVIRDTRRFVATYQFQKRQKREEKVHALYSRAVNAILADNAHEARDALDEILRVEAEHTDALLRLGDIAVASESLEEAVGYYKRAHASDPENLEALFSLEKTMEKKGRWADALGYADQILEIDADNLSALYRKRSILEREGRWHDLMEVQKAILKYAATEREKHKEQANLLGFRYEYARDCLERGEVEKAGKLFRSIIKEDKNFIPAYIGAAEAMLREDDAEGAVSFLEKGYEQTSSVTLLVWLEDALINLGEPSRLIRIYRTSISRHPQNHVLRFLLGKLFFRLEMVDDAIETLSAIDTAESYPELHQLMGELYMRRSQCEKAVGEFKRAEDLRRSLSPAYCCRVCEHASEEWSGRCPSCGTWNTYHLNMHGTCKA